MSNTRCPGSNTRSPPISRLMLVGGGTLGLFLSKNRILWGWNKKDIKQLVEQQHGVKKA